MERDRLELTTPEGVTLDLELGGVGSRALAGILDLIIQGVMLYAVMAVLLVGAFTGVDNAAFFIIAVLLAIVAVLVGYHVLFEVYVGGATPGKRMIGLKVVRTDGGPLRLSQSLIRTFLRIIDYLPGLYAVGLVSIFASRRNQRLGDMAAGTVVVLDRSRHGPPARRGASDSRRDTVVDRPPVPPGWDVSRVTEDEVALVRRFLDRRPSLDIEARVALAHELANRLRPKVVSPASETDDERFLEQVVAIKTGLAY